MTGSGIDLQLLFMQLFFMAAGLSAGIRFVDDVKHWLESRASRTTDV